MTAAPVPNSRRNFGLPHSGHFFFTGSEIDWNNSNE